MRVLNRGLLFPNLLVGVLYSMELPSCAAGGVWYYAEGSRERNLLGQRSTARLQHNDVATPNEAIMWPSPNGAS